MKKFLTVLLCVNAFICLGFATNSRIQSLNIDSWMIEKDDTFIWVNPARIVDYKRSFICELGEVESVVEQPKPNKNLSISDSWGGLVYPLDLISKNSVLGVFIGRPQFSFISQIGGVIGDVHFPSDLGRTSIDVTATGTVSVGVLEPQKKFDLIYHMPAVTLWFNYANNIEERIHKYEGQATSGTVKTTRASVEFNIYAGKVFENVGPFSEIDASVGVGFPYVGNSIIEEVETISPTIENEEHSLKTNTGFNLDMNLRGIYKVSGSSKMLLFLTYYLSSLPNSFVSKVDSNRNGTYDLAETLKQERDEKYSNILFTAALNTDLNQKTKMILALSVFNINTYAKASQFSANRKEEEYEVSRQFIYIPVNVAFESNFLKVLTGRLGVRYNIISIDSYEIKDPDDFTAGNPARETKSNVTVSSAEDVVDVSLGLGLNITNSLSLDAFVRQEVLFTGTYLISGVPETLNSSLSLVYRF